MKTILVLILASVYSSSALKCLKSNEEGIKQALPCIFPFTFEGKVHYQCTNMKDPQNRLWCSTKTDEKGNHQKGHWGYCSTGCEEYPDTPATGRSDSAELRCDKTNSEGPQKQKDCVFPFIFENVEHNSCTNAKDPNGKFWCSTLVNATKHHQQRQWGYCDSDCAPKQLFVFEPTTTPETARSPAITKSPEILMTTFPPNSPQTFIYDARKLPLADTEEDYCGYEQTQGFIVGGVDAKRGGYPFIAALGITHPNKPKDIIYVCGGSLINRRYVITAAQCQSEIAPLVSVLLGEHDFSRDPECDEPGCKSNLQKFIIDRNDVIVHKKFDARNFSQGYDIALIRLPRLATTAEQDPNSGVLPICLAWRPDIVLPTEIHYVVGWGRNSTNKSDRGQIFVTGAATNVLQQIQVSKVPFSTCKQSFAGLSISNEFHICAEGENGKDSCSGDSGGPLIARTADGRNGVMYLAGVVSFGSSSCQGNIPGVYTRISRFMDWILANLKQ